jgi:hypothetical protein
MNIQAESSARPTKPLLGIDPLTMIPAARAKPKAPAEPSEEEVYGCVEWFDYQKHSLSAATRAKTKGDKT